MKKLNKTLLAAALMVAAGSANAAISTLGNSSELYMSVYDSSSKNTFSYDLGLKLSDLLANVSNTAYSYAHDFSADANWVAFTGAATFNAATTVYGLVVGSTINPDLMITSSAVGGLPLAANDISVASMIGGAQIHAGQINAGGGLNLVTNSKVVNDGDVAGTGQFTNFNTAFGNQNDGSIAAAYGSSVSFFHESTAYDALSDSQLPWVEAFAGQWKLAGSNLTFGAPVAAVPLPAAVWMFGAGLMGMLRLNRRKSMAV